MLNVMFNRSKTSDRLTVVNDTYTENKTYISKLDLVSLYHTEHVDSLVFALSCDLLSINELID
jgi:hypothetical protein